MDLDFVGLGSLGGVGLGLNSNGASERSGGNTGAGTGGGVNGVTDGDHRKRRRNRTTQSCLNCHTSKRKCDRKRPCQRCIQLGLTGLCVYEIDDPSLRDDPTIDETTRLRNRIAELESLVRELRGKPHPRWAAESGNIGGFGNGSGRYGISRGGDGGLTSPVVSSAGGGGLDSTDPSDKWHLRASKSSNASSSNSFFPNKRRHTTSSASSIRGIGGRSHNRPGGPGSGNGGGGGSSGHSGGSPELVLDSSTVPVNGGSPTPSHAGISSGGGKGILSTLLTPIKTELANDSTTLSSLSSATTNNSSAHGGSAPGTGNNPLYRFSPSPGPSLRYFQTNGSNSPPLAIISSTTTKDSLHCGCRSEVPGVSNALYGLGQSLGGCLGAMRGYHHHQAQQQITTTTTTSGTAGGDGGDAMDLDVEELIAGATTTTTTTTSSSRTDPSSSPHSGSGILPSGSTGGDGGDLNSSGMGNATSSSTTTITSTTGCKIYNKIFELSEILSSVGIPINISISPSPHSAHSVHSGSLSPPSASTGYESHQHHHHTQQQQQQHQHSQHHHGGSGTPTTVHGGASDGDLLSPLSATSTGGFGRYHDSGHSTTTGTSSARYGPSDRYGSRYGSGGGGGGGTNGTPDAYESRYDSSGSGGSSGSRYADRYADHHQSRYDSHSTHSHHSHPHSAHTHNTHTHPTHTHPHTPSTPSTHDGTHDWGLQVGSVSSIPVVPISHSHSGHSTHSAHSAHSHGMSSPIGVGMNGIPVSPINGIPVGVNGHNHSHGHSHGHGHSHVNGINGMHGMSSAAMGYDNGHGGHSMSVYGHV